MPKAGTTATPTACANTSLINHWNSASACAGTEAVLLIPQNQNLTGSVSVIMTNAMEVAELQYRDGFDEGAAEDRVMQGTRLCPPATEPHWTCQGLPANDVEYYTVDVGHAIQGWLNGERLKTYFPPLPDLAQLNAQIPQSEWDEGFDGKPKPPYQEVRIIYVLNPQSGERHTIVGPSIGLKICYEQLVDSVKTMRRLKGAAVIPVIRLSSVPMRTRFGMRTRPHLQIIRWVHFGPAGIANDEAPKLTGPAPSSAELINDAIPF
jgi:hypothetical protein